MQAGPVHYGCIINNPWVLPISICDVIEDLITSQLFMINKPFPLIKVMCDKW